MAFLGTYLTAQVQGYPKPGHTGTCAFLRCISHSRTFVSGAWYFILLGVVTAGVEEHSPSGYLYPH
jgi:hypothetical protein